MPSKLKENINMYEFKENLNMYANFYSQNNLHSQNNFQARAAVFDHTVRGALSPPRVLDSATHAHAQVQDSRAALDNTQDMEHNEL